MYNYWGTPLMWHGSTIWVPLLVLLQLPLFYADHSWAIIWASFFMYSTRPIPSRLSLCPQLDITLVEALWSKKNVHLTKGLRQNGRRHRLSRELIGKNIVRYSVLVWLTQITWTALACSRKTP
uniref:Secreted protein n=1 Tax=Steinernema glaseri TaxID=37863 RepID=A0A1I8AW66_9BILA